MEYKIIFYSKTTTNNVYKFAGRSIYEGSINAAKKFVTKLIKENLSYDFRVNCKIYDINGDLICSRTYGVFNTDKRWINYSR